MVEVTCFLPLAESCRGGASDVLFLLDGGADYDDWITFKKSIGEVMKKYKVGSNEHLDSRFSVVQFSDEVRTEFNFEDHKRIEAYLKALELIKKTTSGMRARLNKHTDSPYDGKLALNKHTDSPLPTQVFTK